MSQKIYDIYIRTSPEVLEASGVVADRKATRTRFPAEILPTAQKDPRSGSMEWHRVARKKKRKKKKERRKKRRKKKDWKRERKKRR